VVLAHGDGPGWWPGIWLVWIVRVRDPALWGTTHRTVCSLWVMADRLVELVRRRKGQAPPPWVIREALCDPFRP
jgi:hypothetical protein